MLLEQIRWPETANRENLIRYVIYGLLLAALLFAAPLATGRPAGRDAVQLVRFGGFHLGGGRSFGSRPSIRRPSLGGLSRRTSSRSTGFLRRIGHALAFAAVLHFLFAGSHGLGFIVLLVVIIGGVVLVMRRRQRRPYPRY